MNHNKLNLALWMNCRDRKWAAVKVLIDNGADIDHVRKWTHDGRDYSSTLLTEAAYANREDALNNLLGNSANVDKPNDRGVTPLMFATKQGHMNAVKILVAKNAKLDHCDDGGKTAAMFAASNGHFYVLVYLANKNADLTIEDQHGKTAIDLAKKNRHWRIVEFIEDRLRAVILEKKQLEFEGSLGPKSVLISVEEVADRCRTLEKENLTLSFEVSVLRRENSEQSEKLRTMGKYIEFLERNKCLDHETELRELLSLCI